MFSDNITNPNNSRKMNVSYGLESKVNKKELIINKENFMDEWSKLTIENKDEQDVYKNRINNIISEIKDKTKDSSDIEKARSAFNHLIEINKGDCLDKGSEYAIILNALNVDYEIYRLSGNHFFFVVNGVEIELTSEKGFDYNRTEGELSAKRQIYLSHLISGYYTARAHNENESGNYQKALILCDKALSVEFEDPGAHMNKGIAFAHLGFLDFAKICFENSLRFNPNGIKANINYAICLHQIGQYEEAQRHYERAKNLTNKQIIKQETINALDACKEFLQNN